VAFNKPPNCLPEVYKARMIEPFAKNAAEAYSRILTRYPLMDRADDAKARLIALHQPVPKPTKAAVAQNKAEEDSRKSPTTLSKLMRNFEKHPSVADAARVGEPTLVDPTPMNPSDVVQQAAKAMAPAPSGSGSHSVSVEVGKGEPPAGQPVPRSDAAPAPPNATTDSPAAAVGSGTTEASDKNELKPDVGLSDANELKPNVSADTSQALPPPQQVNEIQTGDGQQPATTDTARASSSQNTDAAAAKGPQTASDSDLASSKHKKKKGIHKVIPF